MVNEHDLALFTDLYELTMCASYFDNNVHDVGTFELFVRDFPPNRSYFIAAGLEDALNYLENLKFNEAQIQFLKSKRLFKDAFLEYLRDFEFTGDVFAMTEGTVFFPNEPVLSVTAPLIEAQIAETYLLNAINLQTTIATKASRVVHAAQQKPIVDFSLRRTHGIDAGMKVARASFIAGCIGTSNVLAGMKYNIPIYGTMAHSFVMAFENEEKSFEAYAKTFPDTSTFLVDTYDTIKGIEKAIIVAKRMEKQGHKLKAIRLDSGNLTALSKLARKILDRNNLKYVDIFASGNLDEYKVKELLEKGALIDAFGVGTSMGVSKDAPYCDVVYKLVEVKNHGRHLPTMKLSKGKVTLPGKKQVYRVSGRNGKYTKDILALRDENVKGEKLLVKVMEKRKVIYKFPTLEQIRKKTIENLSNLPVKYKKLKNSANFMIENSPDLKTLTAELDKSLKEKL